MMINMRLISCDRLDILSVQHTAPDLHRDCRDMIVPTFVAIFSNTTLAALHLQQLCPNKRIETPASP